MDAILFSANPNRTEVADAISHLARRKALYWSVGFKIAQAKQDEFEYPMYGYIHITGEQVEYRATIREIIPFSRKHYYPLVKPKRWIKAQKEKKHSCQISLAITKIVPFSYNTLKLKRHNGKKVKRAPQSYIRIRPPISRKARAKRS